MKSHPCKITLAEARVIQRFHADEAISTTDPDKEKLHDDRFRYWAGVIDRIDQSTPSPDHKLHSYTHSLEGDLIRLDTPSDEDL